MPRRQRCDYQAQKMTGKQGIFLQTEIFNYSSFSKAAVRFVENIASLNHRVYI
jgi:hypothetical protein